jgi:hypothetical protein
MSMLQRLRRMRSKLLLLVQLSMKARVELMRSTISWVTVSD